VTYNLFDSSTISTPNSSPANSYNGYFSTGQMLGGANNVTVTTADYQTGVQGRWYYPNSGANNLFYLVNAGSTPVGNTGLFHYTVRTDHTKDTGNVDIGYHYVAIMRTARSTRTAMGFRIIWRIGMEMERLIQGSPIGQFRSTIPAG